MVRRLKRHRGIGFWAILLGIAAWVAWRLVAGYLQPQKIESLPGGLHRIERVVDGDTLLLVGGARIRLIGVDTPELDAEDPVTIELARAATRFTQDFVGAGPVRLQFDRERIDAYGRFLAYVYVDDDMLNKELIRQGVGRASLRFNYAERYKRIFREAQAEAQSAERGIWSHQR